MSYDAPAGNASIYYVYVAKAGVFYASSSNACLAPSQAPTPAPTEAPVPAPTEAPTPAPTIAATFPPSTPAPSQAPTPVPTPAPSGEKHPSPLPTVSGAPTLSPTPAPSTSPSTAPSPSPTPAPTVDSAAPSYGHTYYPTSVPKPAPSRVPSPAPTSETVLTVVPEKLALAVGKPAVASGAAYIVNQDPFQFQRGAIWLAATEIVLATSFETGRRLAEGSGDAAADVAWTVDVENSDGVTVDAASGNVSYLIAPRSFAVVTFNLESSGLLPETYALGFAISAVFPGQPTATETFKLDMQVTAQPDADHTRVELVSPPTLGTEWVGLHILPRDADDIAILTDTSADLTATLEARVPTDARRLTDAAAYTVVAVASCSVAWEVHALYYVMTCSVPNVQTAGDWTIAVSLDGADPFFTTVVRAQCRAGKYETPDGTCLACPLGAACDEDGVTLGTLAVLPGYWRSSLKSELVFPCPFGRIACPGSLANGTNATATTDCRDGYVGPLCVTCDADFFLDNSGSMCLSCVDSDSWTSRLALLGFVVALVLLGGCAYTLYTQVTSEREAEARAARLSSTAGRAPLGSRASGGRASSAPKRRRSSAAIVVDHMHTMYVSVVEVQEKYSLQIKCFLLFVTAQVVYSFTNITTSTAALETVHYPEPATSMANLLSVFNLEFISIYPPGCAAPHWNFYDTLRSVTLVPLAVLTLFWLYTLYSLSRKADSKAKKRALGEALGYSALFLELILPSVSTTIAETFVCDRLGDEQFLRADLTIACDGGEERIWWQLYAMFFILVYPVMVPMAIFRVLYFSRQEINIKLKRLDNYESVEVDGEKHVIYSFAALQKKDDAIKQRLIVEEFAKYDKGSTGTLDRDELGDFICHSLLRVGEKARLALPSGEEVVIRIVEFNVGGGTFVVEPLSAEQELDIDVSKVPREWLTRLKRINDDALDEILEHFEQIDMSNMFEALTKYEEAEKVYTVSHRLRRGFSQKAQSSRKKMQRMQSTSVKFSLRHLTVQSIEHGFKQIENELKEQLVLALAGKISHFRKYRWWFGVALLVIRLLQTSVLIFFSSPDVQAALGAAVCLVSICVQRELRPFRHESDEYVSIVSTWCAFIWMQGLLYLRTGVLSSLPDLLVGCMFVAATFMPIFMVVRVIYKIMRHKKKADEETESASTASPIRQGETRQARGASALTSMSQLYHGEQDISGGPPQQQTAV